MSLTLYWMLWAGCIHTTPTKPTMAWRFEARQAAGEVKVLPTLVLHAPDYEVDESTWIGGALSPSRLNVRKRRTAELSQVPAAFGWALPGAIHAAMAGGWPGEFHVGSWPKGTSSKLAQALNENTDPDEVLSEIAQSTGGTGVLVTWVEHTTGHPLSATGPAGDLMNTAAGPLVLDINDEPYAVEVKVGVALIAHDGEVLLRITDHGEGVLRGERGVQTVSSDLARDVATQLAKVWVHPEL